MLHSMPVSNCMHFLMPTKLDDWNAHHVPGIVGVLGVDVSGNCRVIDAFDAEFVPSSRQLAMDERFAAWVSQAGGLENLRFDVFLMPQANIERRSEVVTLLERSCGFRPAAENAYAHAV